MWGVIPAAGKGSRIQPLAFSKELLPVGSCAQGGTERPRAVSEYLIDRMILAGASKLCFVISPGKSDILEYYGAKIGPADACYVVQPQARGLCDALFCSRFMIDPHDAVLVGLPDTIWFPENGLSALADDILSFLLFPVDRPELFDAVVTDDAGLVREIQVKRANASAAWVWGAFRMPGAILHQLYALWQERQCRDEYIGTLVNAYLARGGRAVGVRAGEAYVDVGTVHGYHQAIRLLSSEQAAPLKQTTSHAPRPRTTAAKSPVSTSDAHDTAAPASATATLEPRKATTNDNGNSSIGDSGDSAARQQLQETIYELGPWFQNLDLRGIRTAPDHFLGDYPTVKWRRFASAIPSDLRGMSVLDIGCNAGFYAMEMKKRGADRVLGIDTDEHYLRQARFAAKLNKLEIEYRRMSVYDLASLGERFDLVLFLGVLYHLRHPLLALDLIHEHVSRDWLAIQTMQRGSSAVEAIPDDMDFWDTAAFERPSYPRMFFVEKKYSGDETNWWIPNRACTEAMLRSAGFEPVAHPEEEVFICRHRELPPAPDLPFAVHPPQTKDSHG